jgi:AcrR family transcriptional regulator
MSSPDRTGPQSVSASSGTDPLAVLLPTPPPRERADAARNRAAVLDAAARLFRAHGVDAVSMDAIAAAAGVGKGTLFRRFRDKAGLAVALLDDRERALQQAILSGPAPLGPGAPPADRLQAFVTAYLDYALDHLDLVRMSETGSPAARYRIGAYRFWHRHVAILLAAGPSAGDPDADAHTVLAPLAAEHLRAMVTELGAPRTRESVLRFAAALA